MFFDSGIYFVETFLQFHNLGWQFRTGREYLNFCLPILDFLLATFRSGQKFPNFRMQILQSLPLNLKTGSHFEYFCSGFLTLVENLWILAGQNELLVAILYSGRKHPNWSSFLEFVPANFQRSGNFHDYRGKSHILAAILQQCQNI